MITVKKLLKDKNQDNIWSVGPTQTVLDALHLMAEKNIGAVMVLEGPDLVGIFSERDYARKVILVGRDSRTTMIQDIMTSKVFTVDVNMSINDCMKIFNEKKFRHLPVLDHSKVVGIISIGDIVSSIMKEQQQHIHFLESYISNG